MQAFVIILLLTLFTSTASAEEHKAIDLEYNSQRPGGDYTHFRAASAEDCAQQCEKSQRCGAFDFYDSDNSCWLKSRVYPARHYVGVVSGFKRPDLSKKTTVDTTDTEIHIRQDTQRPGGDYSSFRVKNAQQCSNLCMRDSRCQAFDYTTSDSYCYLKSWKPPAREYRGIISGVKRRYNAQLKSVQKVLLQQGYNPGKADGLMGRNTRTALKKYQKDHQLLITGRMDSATLAALGLRTSPEQIQQNPATAITDMEISEEFAEENVPSYIKAVGLTYLQSADNLYADILAKIPADTVLQILSQNGDWYKVIYQNQVGFVLAESVKKQ